MTTPAQVSIAVTVHYAETSDGAGDALCRAGIVTAHGPNDTVAITVIGAGGVNFYSVDDCVFDDTTRAQGTWHRLGGECGN
jgi:hypothetical protein